MVHTPGSTSVLSAGIDYLTATQHPGMSADLLDSLCCRWLAAREREGYKTKPWRWMGYEGQVIDGLSFGTRPDGTIVRLSGRMADTHGYNVLRLARQVSRLDLQVTILDLVSGLNWAGDCIKTALEDARCQAGITRTLLISGTPEGRTAYIGSRSAERYFRVYDKHAESKGAYPQGSWRWEIEWKGDRANRVAGHVKKNGAKPEHCRSIVCQAFADYGIKVPCEMLPPGWRDAAIHEETTDERRLAWLAQSIAPVLQRMAASVGRDVILDVLGLGDGPGRIDQEPMDDGGSIGIVP